MDWYRRTSPTAVDLSQSSVADKDSDPPLVATSLSPPLSRTLAPVNLLWPVLWGLESTADAHTSTGVSWLLEDGTKVISTSLTNYEFSRHAAPLYSDSSRLQRVRNCRRLELHIPKLV